MMTLANPRSDVLENSVATVIKSAICPIYKGSQISQELLIAILVMNMMVKNIKI